MKHSMIGLVRAARHDFAKAEKPLSALLADAQQRGDQEGVVHAALALGRWHLEAGSPADASRYCDLARGSIESTESTTAPLLQVQERILRAHCQDESTLNAVALQADARAVRRAGLYWDAYSAELLAILSHEGPLVLGVEPGVAICRMAGDALVAGKALRFMRNASEALRKRDYVQLARASVWAWIERELQLRWAAYERHTAQAAAKLAQLWLPGDTTSAWWAYEVARYAGEAFLAKQPGSNFQREHDVLLAKQAQLVSPTLVRPPDPEASLYEKLADALVANAQPKLAYAFYGWVETMATSDPRFDLEARGRALERLKEKRAQCLLARRLDPEREPLPVETEALECPSPRMNGLIVDGHWATAANLAASFAQGASQHCAIETFRERAVEAIGVAMLAQWPRLLTQVLELTATTEKARGDRDLARDALRLASEHAHRSMYDGWESDCGRWKVLLDDMATEPVT